MGMKFNDYPIRGIDVSEHQGTIEWEKVVTLSPDFTAIRVGFGRTTDVQFNSNWTRAKGKTLRIPYWYLDYYSNHNNTKSVYGMPDADWGKEQANYCWNQIKNDNDGTIMFLDIENGGSSYSPPMNEVPTRVHTIAQAFLEEMDRLSGKVNGIYTSLGWIPFFTPWFKNRPFWVAWYNELQTIASVIKAVKAKGWTGKILMWQYTSDGDVDNNGSADGIIYGMDSKALDLNVWTESKAEWVAFKSGVVIPEPPIEPPPSTVVIPTMLVSAFSQKNPNWASIKLGTSTVTIGGYGCLVTVVASVCKYFGKTTDPGQLNRDLIRVKGYENLNWLSYGAITDIYSDIVVDWSLFLKDVAVTEAKIDEALISKRPVIAQVDLVPSTSVLDQHWVLLIGKGSNGYIMMDPIDGTIGDFSSRYKKVLRTVVYTGNPETPSVLIPKTTTYQKGMTQVNSQRVRISPNITSTVVGSINAGQEIPLLAYGFDSLGNPWLRIGHNQWIAQHYGNTEFVKRIYVE